MGTGTTEGRKQAEFVYLFYDVPSNNHKLYLRIRKAIFGVASPCQKSVFVLKIAEKERVEALINEARADTGMDVRINYTVVDPSSTDEVRKMVAQSLVDYCDKLALRLRVKIGKAREENLTVSDAYRESVAKQLDGLERLASIFEITQDVEIAYKAVSDLWRSEQVATFKAIEEGKRPGLPRRLAKKYGMLPIEEQVPADVSAVAEATSGEAGADAA